MTSVKVGGVFSKKKVTNDFRDVLEFFDNSSLTSGKQANPKKTFKHIKRVSVTPNQLLGQVVIE